MPSTLEVSKTVESTRARRRGDLHRGVIGALVRPLRQPILEGGSAFVRSKGFDFFRSQTFLQMVNDPRAGIERRSNPA